jgi:hypothetical protein
MRAEFEIPPAGDDASEVKLAGELRAGVNRARYEHRMTFVQLDGDTLAALVPVDVAVAMEPRVVRMSGDTCWTELPATGMFCAQGRKIGTITWRKDGGHPEAEHLDGSVCDHTAHPELG